MHPTLNEDNGKEFMNNYYCVEHTWTERNEERKFIPLPITKNIYSGIGIKTRMTKIMMII